MTTRECFLRRAIWGQSGGLLIFLLLGAAQASGADERATRSGPIEQVTVTAQKRSERLQDVPVPVTAVNADQLVNTSQLELRDFYNKIPGLNLTEAGIYGGSVIAVRGITSGILDSTTNVVIDDVPYMSTSVTGPSTVVPELDPNDLARLEVLRGPQGTLYGASSMGGLLKYVTIDPSTERMSGYLHGGASDIRNGDGLAYNASGGINVPLGTDWAVRASAFTRHTPGYIDDPVHDIQGVNAERVTGGRVTALWKPSDVFSLKLGALLQDAKADGNTFVNLLPGLSQPVGLTQNTTPGSGGYSKKLQVYTANLSATLGKSELVAISSYTINHSDFGFDLTPFFGPRMMALYGVGGSTSTNDGTTRKFTQEIRLTTPIGEKAEWLFGLFYDDVDNPRLQRYYANDFNTGARVADFGFIDFPSTFKEKAVFTNFTYHFTDRFDVQVGGRLGYNRQTLPHYDTGGALFAGGASQSQTESKDHSFTYLFTPRFAISSELMVYARLASGYRPGGPNINTAADPAIPLSYKPDRTYNYEIGVKGSTSDQSFTYDLSVYYIDWKNIQLGGLVSPRGFNFKDNGGDARSSGVDVSLDWRPWDRFTLSTWGAWNLAELRSDFPVNSSVTGLSGDRLPFSSRFSGYISAEQGFMLGNDVEGFVGASLSFVGDRKGPFTPGTGARQDLPSYYNTDVRAGARWSSWTVSLFVNNVADRRGLLMGPVGAFVPTYIYTNPRTGGVTLQKTF